MSRHWSSRDWCDVATGVFVAMGLAFFALFLVVMAACAIDGWYGNRAARKQIACAVQRMDHRRVPFTTEVTCVPKALDTRNDTLTIR